jgi:manganese/iron transport system permease protein
VGAGDGCDCFSGIGSLFRATKMREDTAIGIVFAGMFALGIALISTVRNYTVT